MTEFAAIVSMSVENIVKTSSESQFSAIPSLPSAARDVAVGEALHFDDLEAGDSWVSPERTVTQVDVECFARLTGDENPLHLDAAYASTTPFGQPIAHGLFGLSLVAGLGSRHPPLQPAIFVKIVNWQFLRPIYIGDAVRVRTEVLEKRPAGRRRGTVIWKRQLLNQDGQVVQEGTAETLIPIARRRNLPR